MQFPWVAGYWRQRLSHQRCPCSSSAEHSQIGPRQDVTVSCTEDKALCKRHRGVFLSSLQWSTSGRVWLQHWLGFWVFKCTGKGTLFAPNKSRLGLAFLTGAWGKEARQQLKSNKLLPSTTGMARYGQAELVLLFEAFLWVAFHLRGQWVYSAVDTLMAFILCLSLYL